MELDLKKLARACGAKKVELASLKDLEPLTGYIRGGVTVIGAKRPFPAFVDETIELFDIVSVSAGQRGLQLLLAPADYLRAAAASLADLAKLLDTRVNHSDEVRPDELRSHCASCISEGSSS